MKRFFVLLTAFGALLLVTACNQEPAPTKVTAPAEPAPAASAPSDASGTIAKGQVVETMNTAGYTYVLVDKGGDKVWAATPECVVKVGDQVVIPQGAPMPNFHSDTLNRDFDLVYFVGAIQDADGNPLPRAGGAPAGQSMSGGHGAMGGHGTMGGKPAPTDIDLSGIEKPEGGKTVGEIYAGKADLSDKEVTFRGKVVKFNGNIMGKNWIHVRDGSGDAADGSNDLTVTTADATAKPGDTVLVTGKVHLDKDFGAGYKYGVIIEDAKVVVE